MNAEILIIGIVVTQVFFLLTIWHMMQAHKALSKQVDLQLQMIMLIRKMCGDLHDYEGRGHEEGKESRDLP